MPRPPLRAPPWIFGRRAGGCVHHNVTGPRQQCSINEQSHADNVRFYVNLAQFRAETRQGVWRERIKLAFKP